MQLHAGVIAHNVCGCVEHSLRIHKASVRILLGHLMELKLWFQDNAKK